MTIEEIKNSSAVWLTPAQVAPILGVNPQTLRVMAATNPAALGFPVIVMGSRVKIPKVPFLHFMGQ